MTYAFKRQRDARNAAAISRQRPPSTIGKPDNPGRGSNWLAKAPTGGIPAESGQPGYAECEIYSVVNGQVVAMPDGTGTLTVEIFNLAATEIPEGDIVPVWQVGGVFVANGPAALDCKRICEECPPYSTENGGCGEPLQVENCVEGCDFSQASVENFTLADGVGETWTQTGPAEWGRPGAENELSVPVESSVNGAEWLRLNYRCFTDTNTVSGDPGSHHTFGILKAQGGFQVAVTGAQICGDSSYTVDGSVVPGTSGGFNLAVPGVPCSCCRDCPYEGSAITGLTIDNWNGGGQTASQTGPSELWKQQLAPVGEDYCQWFVPMSAPIDQFVQVRIVDDAGTKRIFVYNENDSGWGHWKDLPNCGGTLTGFTPDFGNPGDVTLTITDGGNCPEIAAGLGASFISANPDLASRSGCKCKDAVAIMNKLPPEKLRSRITLLAKLFHKPGGASLLDISQRLRSFLDEI